eukprot:TRINITY_DN9378_c1_g1_i1.p1 TRINITY_DN9378_c1_g1~~TRINITY_DN9378_c1_g1_i1.p1  ORF type:complete len:362 (-),score=99.75 TRINITY_DN9378_c1_g1_i1:115-1158(-)
MAEQDNKVPAVAENAVMVQSETLPEGTPTVRGYDFEAGLDFQRFLSSYLTTGFQAMAVGQAMEQINSMLEWRLSDEAVKEDDDVKDEAERAKVRCKVFLGYTSNLISSGLRETFKFLTKHKMVDVIVTTAGGIEEDIIKCLAPTFLGDFSLSGEQLRKRGINRIGNLLVPNENYVKFENFLMPLLDQMLKEQEENNVEWTPSSFIHRLGKEIDNEDSVYYWCYKNNIPVYCPALTDGSIGDMIYFHSYKHEARLKLDIAADIRNMNNEAAFAIKTGIIILGGGLVKHHICNANLMRNGADFSVFVNTGQEFDGSDSGARYVAMTLSSMLFFPPLCCFCCLVRLLLLL